MPRTNHLTRRKNLLCLLLTLAALVVLSNHFRTSARLREEGAASAPLTAQSRTASTLKPDDATKARVAEAYGKLPLSFEANNGQVDGRVQFLSRGDGYSLFLTSKGTVLSLRRAADKREEKGRAITKEAAKDELEALNLEMQFVGANNSSRVSGVEQLAGKSNYFIGDEPGKWRSNISSYSKVRYENIYPGIDLIYYGNQRQLEYDFVVAPGADPGLIFISFAGAQSVALDEEGELVIRARGGEVRQRRPVSYQEINGRRLEVYSRYVIRDGKVGFELGDYDRTKPLVIDPILVYSTFLGGGALDQAYGIALGADGSAYVTGITLSTNFPTVSPLQGSSGSPGNYDVFVTKINPAGSAIVYSTYLGGNQEDRANGISVDAAGNAYVAGFTFSDNFPTASALQNSRLGVTDVFLTKLNAAGTALVYSTYLGGSEYDQAFDLAIDSADNAYVTGLTASKDFPTASAFQPVSEIGLAYKSSNGGAAWAKSDAGLAGTVVTDLVVDPVNPLTIYAGTIRGIFKSTDGGASWNALGTSTTGSNISKLAIDKSNPQTLYASSTFGLFKSTNGGASWSASGTGLPSGPVGVIAIDPTNSAVLYAGFNGRIYKSTNSGANWSATTQLSPSVSFINKIVVDAGSNVFLATNLGIYKSTNGGSTWALINGPIVFSNISALAADPVVPGTLYAATSQFNFIYKSTDGGATWNAGDLQVSSINVLAVAPSNSSIIYAGGQFGQAIYKSTDAGVHWSATNTGFNTTQVRALAVDPTDADKVYAGVEAAYDGFVTKVNSSGSALVYSTYIGGSGSENGADIVVDSSGNAYVTGFTSSLDFPVANAVQPQKAAGFGDTDAFALKLNNVGNALVYSTYLGGTGSDAGLGIAIDSSGNAYISGQTSSDNFPTANAFQPSLNEVVVNFQTDAFVTKLNPTGSALVFSTYLGGEGDDAAHHIAVDNAGNIYLTGITTTNNFPVNDSLQDFKGGGGDAFVTKMNPQGSALIYSSFLGGALGSETGRAIAVDAQGNAYVAGSTASSDFPLANPLQATKGAGSDGFIAKISTAPDLVVTITDSRDPIFVGSNLTYTITVSNNGSSTATGVVLTDALASDVDFVSAATSQGTCSNGPTVQCNLGNLAKDATATVTLVVTTKVVKTISNTASANGNEPDILASNNSATETTVVSAQPNINGRVTGTNGSGLANVTLTLSGITTGSVQTDANGYYLFTGLTTGGNYTVTPSLNNHAFTPPSRSFNNLTQDQTADFTATVCSYSIAPSQQSFGATGGNGSVVVTATGGCAWTATSNVNWITITSGSSGTGDGTVTFNVAPATSEPRSGILTIAGMTFTVFQEFDSCGSASFKAAQNYRVDISPISLVSADFNGDGRPDLVALQQLQGLNYAAVLLANSTGGFNPVAKYPTGGLSQSIVVADMNKDGKLDLVVSDLSYFSILLGDGAGGFGAPIDTQVPVGGHLRHAAVGDFNGDGNQDVALANSTSNNISVLLGNGAGGFGTAVNYPAGRLSSRIEVADLNKDGKLDLVIGSGDNGGVSILLGNGTGGFGAPTVYPAPLVAAGRMVIADFNVDGNLDIAASGGSIAVWLGDGTGKFGAPKTFTVQGVNTRAIAAADLNNDAKLDLAVSLANNKVKVFEGDGTGNFVAKDEYPVENEPFGVVAADFNADKKIDLAVANYNGGNVSILLNNCALLPPNLSLNSATYTVNEGEQSGVLVVTVNRTGNTSAAASVDYITSDSSGMTPCQTNTNGIASERCDYVAVVGTLRFAAGETSRTIQIPLVNDVYQEPSESFTITLRNAQAAVIGTSSAAVSIEDNDAQAATSNPIDDQGFFIKQQYIDFLGRVAEPAGFDFWMNRMNNCPQGQVCDRIDTSQRFFQSDEFQERGFYVYRLYDAVLGRLPRYNEFVPDTARLSGYLTVAEQRQNKDAYLADFINKTEFKNLYAQYLSANLSQATDPTGFVDALCAKAGITPASKPTLINNLQAGTRTPAQTLEDFILTPEMSNVGTKFYDRGFITMQYFGYLRRDPEPAGFDFWVGQLIGDNAPHRQDYRFMVGGFLNSDEYRFRFALISAAP